MLVTWPFVMLLMDYWPLVDGQNQWDAGTAKLVLRKAAFLLLLSAGACIVTILSQRSGAALAPLATARWIRES
jgi:hypothetical protein